MQPALMHYRLRRIAKKRKKVVVEADVERKPER